MEKYNVIDKKDCTGCMACKSICPKNAINIYEDEEGFKFPTIDRKLCVKCGLCKKVCPVISKLQDNEYNIEVYACINRNKDERLQSSSGGIFSLIARYILENGGTVFGAKFNDKLEVIHDYIENEKQIQIFRGSKYLQSDINNIYIKVKEKLLNNKLVLFTGTPCQIEGLLGYLGHDYDNLYTQDIICHGVPSPKVWRKYIQYKKEKNGEYPNSINFRRKDILGWSNYQVSYKYSEKEENIQHDEDPYMKIFLKNLDLRKSCYNCKFKKIHRNSDLTIADFWGINEVNPKLNDEKGISALIIHSRKGKKIFDSIKDKIEYCKADISDIIKYNSCICNSTQYNEKRDEFFKDLNICDFDELIKKYL